MSSIVRRLDARLLAGRLLAGLTFASLFALSRIDVMAATCCASCKGGTLCCEAADTCACGAKDNVGCNFQCPGEPIQYRSCS